MNLNCYLSHIIWKETKFVCIIYCHGFFNTLWFSHLNYNVHKGTQFGIIFTVMCYRMHYGVLMQVKTFARPLSLVIASCHVFINAPENLPEVTMCTLFWNLIWLWFLVIGFQILLKIGYISITLQNSQFNPFPQLKLGATLSLWLFGMYFLQQLRCN